MISPLWGSGFRYFAGGQLVSLLGSSMAPIALTFAVLDASGNPTELGVVLAARMVPMLCFILVGGAVADRFPRRTVLIAANAGGALTQGAVAAVLITHNYDLLLISVLSAANGVLDALTSPALRGLVPELVAQDQLRKANALLSSVRNATKLIGPALAGVLVATAGSGPTIAIDAVSYLLAALILGQLRPTTGKPEAPRGTRFTTPARPTRPTWPTRRANTATAMFADIRRGWDEFKAIRWVWAVTLSSALMNLANTGVWQVLGPPLTKNLAGEATWGLVLSTRGIGLLVMSALMYRLVVRHLLRTGQLLSALGALPLLTLALGLQPAWLLATAFAAGIGFSISGVSWDTSLQEHIDRGVLSRISSLDDLFSFIAIPIGLLAAGPLAHRFGAQRVTLVAAVIYLLSAWGSLLFKDVRELPHGVRAA
ncbi:MAG TPA: MFS transporter [Kribbella sp.]|nr:MFS transporter [Kribbella sp.]